MKNVCVIKVTLPLKRVDWIWIYGNTIWSIIEINQKNDQFAFLFSFCFFFVSTVHCSDFISLVYLCKFDYSLELANSLSSQRCRIFSFVHAYYLSIPLFCCFRNKLKSTAHSFGYGCWNAFVYCVRVCKWSTFLSTVSNYIKLLKILFVKHPQCNIDNKNSVIIALFFIVCDA